MSEGLRDQPPPPRASRRTSQIEHYYLINHQFQLIPGGLKYSKNLARDLHDIFNLVALLPISALNFANWDW